MTSARPRGRPLTLRTFISSILPLGLLLPLSLASLAATPAPAGKKDQPPPDPQSGLLPPPPAPAFEGTTHTQWTRRDGAPGSITSLAQTTDGYLWIGSSLGLYRFDGLKFTPYPFGPRADELPSLDVASLAADPDGGLWIAMRSTAVVHLKADGNTVLYGLQSGLTPNTLDQIIVRDDGTVWVAGGSRLFRLEGDHWMDYRSRGLWDGGVFSVLFDHAGNIWIGRDKRLAILRKGAPKFEDLPDPVHYVSSMVQSSAGQIWIADAWRSVRPLNDTSTNGVFHIQGKAELLLDHDDTLWVAQDDEGLARIRNISRPDIRSVEVAGSNDLTARQTHALLEDHDGNIWVGTDRGLDRFKKTLFVPFRGTELRFFPTIIAANDGAVWINSHGSSLMRVQHGTISAIGPHVNTGPFVKRRNGDICFADLTAYELQCYGSSTFREKLPGEMNHVPPKAMVEDSDGALLLSTQGKGIWRYSNDQWAPYKILGAKTDSPWDLYLDSLNRLWLGYGENRIIYRDGPTFHALSVEDGPWSNTLVFAEGAGALWVSGSNGLCFFDGNRFRRVKTLEPLLLRGTSGIAFDHSGSMWLNSGAGVIRITSDELVKLRADPQHLARAQVFDENDGLSGQPTQYKRVPSAAVDNSGTLWFATSGNVVSLDPTRLKTRQTFPSVLIESASINGKPVMTSALTGAVLKTAAKRLHDLEITYIGIDLSAPERVYYRYRLVNEDRTWQDAGSRRQAFYTRLSPGSYEFQVSASNGGDWVELAAPFRIEVKPAFYQTVWFKLLCILALALAVWLSMKARTELVTQQLHSRMSERLAERERVARELHDGLLQGFQGLMMRFHLATQTIPDKEPARSEMEQALDRADELLIQSRDRIRDLRYEAMGPASLVASLTVFQHELDPQQGAGFSVLREGEEHDLNPLSYEEIYAVTREALLNAHKHSGGSDIEVLLRFEAQKLIVRVQDNGRGTPREVLDSRRKSNHWGIAGMFERAANLNADLKISSGPEGGTRVQLVVPAGSAYRQSSITAWDHLRNSVTSPKLKKSSTGAP